MSIRQDLVGSAVTFLRDPSVAQSPLAKRLQFLESKGLTPAETDEALRQASSGPFGGSYGGRMEQQQRGRYGNAEEVARDWRDWFIMTVIGGGVGYLAISLARVRVPSARLFTAELNRRHAQKYLMPALQPPTQTDLEEAQSALAQKYDEAAAILSTLQVETDALKGEMTAQSAKVDGAVKEVRDAMETCMKGETERDEEMEKIKEEVDALKELLPRVRRHSLVVDLRALTLETGPREAKGGADGVADRPAKRAQVAQVAPPLPSNRRRLARRTGHVGTRSLSDRSPGPIPARQLDGRPLRLHQLARFRRLGEQTTGHPGLATGRQRQSRLFDDPAGDDDDFEWHAQRHRPGHRGLSCAERGCTGDHRDGRSCHIIDLRCNVPSPDQLAHPSDAAPPSARVCQLDEPLDKPPSSPTSRRYGVRDGTRDRGLDDPVQPVLGDGLDVAERAETFWPGDSPVP